MTISYNMLNTIQYEKQILEIINKLYKKCQKSFSIVKKSVRPVYDSRAGPVRSWSHEAKKSDYGPRAVKF